MHECVRCPRQFDSPQAHTLFDGNHHQVFSETGCRQLLVRPPGSATAFTTGPLPLLKPTLNCNRKVAVSVWISEKETKEGVVSNTHSWAATRLGRQDLLPASDPLGQGHARLAGRARANPLLSS